MSEDKPLKRREACCFCRIRPRRGVKYRDCRECHAAHQAKTRERTISTVLPEDFWSWPLEEQEAHVLNFIKDALAEKRAIVPRATIPRGTEF